MQTRMHERLFRFTASTFAAAEPVLDEAWKPNSCKVHAGHATGVRLAGQHGKLSAIRKVCFSAFADR